jgi:predicted nucleic acid-binding protein
LSVFDASVVVDALAVAGPAGHNARQALADQPILQAPAILKAETTSGLRGLEARGELSPLRALTALDQVRRLDVRSYPISPFLGRIWELRSTLSVYDAWYVALAEELGTDLITADARLATAPGPRCSIDLVGA